MSGRRTNLIAPLGLAAPSALGPTARGLRRDLSYIVVPPAPMTELLHGTRTSSVVDPNRWKIVGEASGPAIRIFGQGMNFPNGTTYGPGNVPLTVVAFVVCRNNANNQALIGNGFSGGNGWTFWLCASGGQLGFTRWGTADNHSTLGALPTNVPLVVGLSHDGTTARYFQHGKFQSVASGSVTAGAATYGFGANPSTGSFPVQNTSVHVMYLWKRALSDAEMLTIYRDPWVLVRPRTRRAYSASAASATGVRTFVPSFLG